MGSLGAEVPPFSLLPSARLKISLLINEKMVRNNVLQNTESRVLYNNDQDKIHTLTRVLSTEISKNIPDRCSVLERLILPLLENLNSPFSVSI